MSQPGWHQRRPRRELGPSTLPASDENPPFSLAGGKWGEGCQKRRPRTEQPGLSSSSSYKEATLNWSVRGDPMRSWNSDPGPEILSSLPPWVSVEAKWGTGTFISTWTSISTQLLLPTTLLLSHPLPDECQRSLICMSEKFKKKV